CKLDLYYNGKAERGASIALSGNLAAGATYVVCNAALAQTGAPCNQTAALNFNGDEAIVLVCRDNTLDVLGQVGFDPGDYWGDVVRPQNRDLRRSCSIQTGDREPFDPFDPAFEWLTESAASLDDLGRDACVRSSP